MCNTFQIQSKSLKKTNKADCLLRSDHNPNQMYPLQSTSYLQFQSIMYQLRRKDLEMILQWDGKYLLNKLAYPQLGCPFWLLMGSRDAEGSS